MKLQKFLRSELKNMARIIGEMALIIGVLSALLCVILIVTTAGLTSMKSLDYLTWLTLPAIFLCLSSLGFLIWELTTDGKTTNVYGVYLIFYGELETIYDLQSIWSTKKLAIIDATKYLDIGDSVQIRPLYIDKTSLDNDIEYDESIYIK